MAKTLTIRNVSDEMNDQIKMIKQKFGEVTDSKALKYACMNIIRIQNAWFEKSKEVDELQEKIDSITIVLNNKENSDKLIRRFIKENY